MTNPHLIAVLNQALGITDSHSRRTARNWSIGSPPRSSAREIPVRGRQVYQSKLANCTACHKVAGQGGDIGPDLSVVGSAVPAPLIIESVLWPNRR